MARPVPLPPVDRMRRRRRTWGVALLLFGALVARPAAAQYQERPEDGEARARYNLEPPVDPLANLRAYCRDRVPNGWWCDDPVRLSYGFRLLVTIPEGWRGNPSGAMLDFCPQRSDPVWKDVPRIEFQSRNGKTKHLGAPITCWPP
ncbi:hypothetical protein L2U69_05505 [Zavarzinia compransoris]|uniref:hypothetical protein n=1 Tax=Zavarzinia marina TaxID=2911065 RepID=UPI001F202519|nr:hypothetical protein [Zavarzinia marina]MCF4165090.1 hypothetical protein [Zavarzinia marina]